MEDVPTWEPLALVDHLLTTDDANVVNSLQFLWGDIWVTGGRGREGGGAAGVLHNHVQNTFGQLVGGAYTLFRLYIARLDMMTS